MIRRVLAVLLCLAPLSAAAFWQSRDSNYNVSVVSGYTGPLDIVSSATALYALRAESAAIAAAGTQTLVNVRRASDNITCDFLVASSGGFGVTTSACNSSTQGGVSYGTFVGSDGTASCTLAGTTAACTGATGTVHVNDVVTGTGLTQPCIVTSASNTAPTLEIAGTTNSCGSIGSSETFTFQVAGFVTELYDQSGNSSNASQATASKEAQFLPSVLSGHPALYFNASNSQIYTGTMPSASLGSFAGAANRTVTTGNEQSLFATANGSNQMSVSFSSTPNTMKTYSGANVSVSAADGSWHAFQSVVGSSAIMSADGTSNTGNSGLGNPTTTVNIGGLISATTWLNGYLEEVGLWGSVSFTTGQIASINSNTHSYLGF